MYNLYIFRIVMPLPYTSKVFLFIKTNITDFFEQFEDMTINCGFSDDCKV